jgi:mRNA-degrading endonuclease YafQ of YafQ-DinJ toxin-antitoxin module
VNTEERFPHPADSTRQLNIPNDAIRANIEILVQRLDNSAHKLAQNLGEALDCHLDASFLLLYKQIEELAKVVAR